MAHVALYRKYRSQTFGELVGQEHVVHTIQNAIDRNAIHHAYLFTGPRGTGKTSTARLLAKALNCEHGPTSNPCGTCYFCTSISQGSLMDVVEMDAASEAGVEAVREKIVDVVDYHPTECRTKVYIIDEVHDLSSKAFDALLKTIEEPPAHVVFVLATTELHKVPPTIQSRCQKYNFNRGGIPDLVGRLKTVTEAEGREADEIALRVIARLADGGYRDALSLLEQALVTTDGKVTLEHIQVQFGLISEDLLDSLLTAISKGDAPNTIKTIDTIYRSGKDAMGILEGMLTRLGDLTRAAYGIESGLDSAVEASMKAVASEFGAETLIQLREMIASLMRSAREVSLPRLWLESVLLGFHRAPKPLQTPVSEPKVTPQKATRAVVQEAVVAPSKTSSTPAADSPWERVRDAVSSISKQAKIRIEKCSLDVIEGKPTVCFEREMDYDWVIARGQLIAKLNELWDSEPGVSKGPLVFTFGSNKGKADSNGAVPAVELPLEGKRLADAIDKEFEGL